MLKLSLTRLAVAVGGLALSLTAGTRVASADPDLGPAINTTCSYQQVVSALNAHLTDPQLVNQLYMTVLSRYPTGAEMQTATTYLGTNPNHSQAAEDLFWSLFNKVDFVFNY